MNPVTTALETIKAIQNETRGQIHAQQAGSSLLIDSVLARSLSASSLARSDLSNRPSKSSEDSAAVRQFNEDSIPHPMAEAEVTAGPTCREQELRIDQQDRILIGSHHGLTRRAMVMLSAGSLVALLFCCGWIAGRIPSFFTEPESLQLKKVDSSAAPMSAASDRLALQPSSAKPKASNRMQEVPRPGAQTIVLTTQQTTKPATTTVERSKEITKPTPVPETRPTTIAGWTVRAVNGGTAMLEGPNGVWRAARGDTVPGLGKIDSIVRWGNRWIVATSRGLVSTP
jgi:hypothetical protein